MQAQVVNAPEELPVWTRRSIFITGVVAAVFTLASWPLFLKASLFDLILAWLPLNVREHMVSVLFWAGTGLAAVGVGAYFVGRLSFLRRYSPRDLRRAFRPIMWTFVVNASVAVLVYVSYWYL